jgi:hypothetical protein
MISLILYLYSRPGCHLCEELHEALEPIVRGRAEIRHIDVSADQRLERLYGLRIPVLVAGNVELSGYPLDRERVARYLDTL